MNRIASKSIFFIGLLVDKVAGSSRWINIDASEVKEKIRQGWNVRSPEAGVLLVDAARAGDIDTVRTLLQAGANARAKVDLRDWMDCKPLRRVASPSLFITPIQRAKGVAVVKLLIDAGADVNAKSALEPPLRYQVETLGDAASVRALIEAGANIEYETAFSRTVLMWAVSHSDPAIVEALLQGGARVNAKDYSGHTALDFVRPDSPITPDQEAVIRLLLAAGAKNGDALRGGGSSPSDASEGLKRNRH